MLKAHMKPLSKGGQVVKHAGKGSVSESLPSRHAMSSLTSGSQADRSMNNYAKQTPMPSPPPSPAGPMASALGGLGGAGPSPAMDLSGGLGGMGKSGGI